MNILHFKVAVLAGFLWSAPVFAGDYTIGNYDINGSRAIPDKVEKNLTKANIENKGLEVKFFTPTDGPVVGVPVVYQGVVYAGSTDFSQGSFYAIDAKAGKNLGKIIYNLPMPGGVLASPLIHKNALYVASFHGVLYKIHPKTGKILWQSHSLLSVLDSVWAGPIAVSLDERGKRNHHQELIILAINPQDEFPGSPLGIGRVLAYDEKTGEEVWQRVINEPGEGGSGIWGTSPSFSSKLGLIFIGTGQTTIPNNPERTSNTSNAIYALDANTGEVRWKTQLRHNDVWNFSEPFYPEDPKDTDAADSPALFVGHDGKEYVAMGSKRGYFYVMNAKTGVIQNGSGMDSLGFKKGLDLFNYSGVGVVGDSLDGGVNLDSGYFKQKDKTIHFSILLDYKAALENVFNKVPPYVDGVCMVAGFFPTDVPCPLVTAGNLVLINGQGTAELGRFTDPAAHLFSPLYLNNMIIASENSNEFGGNVPAPNRVIVIDVSDPAHPMLIQKVNLTFGAATANSGGAMLSVADGMIYVGNGFFGFGPQQGLFGIGLKK